MPEHPKRFATHGGFREVDAIVPIAVKRSFLSEGGITVLREGTQDRPYPLTQCKGKSRRGRPASQRQ